MRKQNAAYLRVSTEAQTEKYGLDMQKEKILEYCDREGIVIDKWYIDGGYSGSKLDRPEIQRLLDDVDRGMIDKVFIYKLDRMSRDVIDTLNLLYRVLPKYGVHVVSTTENLRFENPMDKVMIGVNAVMGQYEREIIYMRTRAGMKERVKNGLWPGGGKIPLGYYYDRNDGILHPHPEQAEKVREAYRMYIEGYSCANISKILGFTGDRTVKQFLRRKSNIGLIEYKGEVYKGMHEPIIDEKTFYKAQECMEKRHTNSHVANDHILTGLCYCGVCGARMRYQKWGKSHKIICYSQYKSSNECMVKDPNCDNYRANAKEVEEAVEDIFKRFALSVEQGEQRESKVESIEAAIKKSNTKIKKYYSLYADNDNENLLELIREEEEKVKELKRQLVSEQKKERKLDADMIEKVKRVVDVWDDLNGKEKNMILKDYIEKVVITKGNIDVHFVEF